MKIRGGVVSKRRPSMLRDSSQQCESRRSHRPFNWRSHIRELRIESSLSLSLSLVRTLRKNARSDASRVGEFRYARFDSSWLSAGNSPPPRPSSPEGGIEPLNSRAPSPANSHLASGQTCANVRANGNATYVSAVEGARALRISLKPRTSPGLVG